MTPSRLHRYYWTLSIHGRAGYAHRAGTSTDYIRLSLIPKYRGPVKVPRPLLMRELARATHGKISYQDVLEHFYPKTDPRQRGARRA